MALYVQQLEAGSPSKLLLEQSRMVLEESVQLVSVVRDCCVTLQTGAGSGIGTVLSNWLYYYTSTFAVLVLYSY